MNKTFHMPGASGPGIDPSVDTRPIDTRKRIRIYGWKTPKTRPGALFGMTLPKSYGLRKEDVPKSATVVYCFDMDAPKCKSLELKREDLDGYKIV